MKWSWAIGWTSMKENTIWYSLLWKTLHLWSFLNALTSKMRRRQVLLCLLLPPFCPWLWNSNLLYGEACWITLFTDLWWPKNANFFPQALLWAVSNMQADGVLGKISLGSMNFIWTRDVHFPYILELCVWHKSGFISKLSPRSCLHSLARVWVGYSFCSLYFSAQQFFPKMTEGCSGGTDQLFLASWSIGIMAFQEFPLSCPIRYSSSDMFC